MKSSVGCTTSTILAIWKMVISGKPNFDKGSMIAVGNSLLPSSSSKKLKDSSLFGFGFLNFQVTSEIGKSSQNWTNRNPASMALDISILKQGY